MMWFGVGFLSACIWGFCCYQAGKKSAQRAYLKEQIQEYDQVEQVFATTAHLQRDELLKRLRNNAQK